MKLTGASPACLSLFLMKAVVKLLLIFWRKLKPWVYGSSEYW